MYWSERIAARIGDDLDVKNRRENSSSQWVTDRRQQDEPESWIIWWRRAFLPLFGRPEAVGTSASSPAWLICVRNNEFTFVRWNGKVDVCRQKSWPFLLLPLGTKWSVKLRERPCLWHQGPPELLQRFLFLNLHMKRSQQVSCQNRWKCIQQCRDFEKKA